MKLETKLPRYCVHKRFFLLHSFSRLLFFYFPLEQGQDCNWTCKTKEQWLSYFHYIQTISIFIYENFNREFFSWIKCIILKIVFLQNTSKLITSLLWIHVLSMEWSLIPSILCALNVQLIFESIPFNNWNTIQIESTQINSKKGIGIEMWILLIFDYIFFNFHWNAI